MAADADNVSAEEKLLRVIQSSGEAPKEAKPAVAESAGPAEYDLFGNPIETPAAPRSRRKAHGERVPDRVRQAPEAGGGATMQTDETVPGEVKESAEAGARESELRRKLEKAQAEAAELRAALDNTRRDFESTLGQTVGALSEAGDEESRLRARVEELEAEAARAGKELESARQRVASLEENARVREDRQKAEIEKVRQASAGTIASLEERLARALGKKPAVASAGSVPVSIEVERMRPGGRRSLSKAVFAAASVAILAGLIFVGVRASLWMSGSETRREPPGPRGIEGAGARSGGSRAGMPDSSPTGSDTTPGPGAAGQENLVTTRGGTVWPRLEIAGAQVTYGEAACTIVFEQPVFSALATVSPEGQEALGRAASQLRDRMARYRLTVEGHTDAAPLSPRTGYADNTALGLARARAAAAVLAGRFGIPAASISAASAGGKNPPYPNDSAESRKKNRTVVLKLTVRN